MPFAVNSWHYRLINIKQLSNGIIGSLMALINRLMQSVARLMPLISRTVIANSRLQGRIKRAPYFVGSWYSGKRWGWELVVGGANQQIIHWS